MVLIPMYSKVNKIAFPYFSSICLIKMADKNKSATVFLHEIGKDLGDTSRPYPRETMTIGAMRAGQGEVANSVEQRRKQES